MTRVLATALLLGLLLAGLIACTGGEDPSADPSSSSSDPTSSSSATPSAPPTATPVPPPPAHGCYALTYRQAVAPTVARRPVDCARRHSAMTFAVGRLDAVVDGHLLAVDSRRVQAQVADTCPARFASFVGGTVEDRRLSMLRTVWFTPTVAQSDAGASWYRCDVVALAGDEHLAPLTGRLAGVLDTSAGQARYGVCGTAQPGAAGFRRVICSRPHAWRAVAVVPFRAGRYPGASEVRQAGQDPCQRAGKAAASDSLNYRWGYEWPSKRQWADGQHFGRCWVPD